MARTKKQANGSTDSETLASSSSISSTTTPEKSLLQANKPPREQSQDSDRPISPLSVPVAPEDREVVKVNNANPTELKNACDDAVKRYLSRPKLFDQNFTHTDIRLALGWASVFVAAGTGLYGYKVAFEQAKPIVWAGMILYVLLTGVQTLYSYFIEGNTVYQGKRKTFSKRIQTERLSIASSTLPTTSSPPHVPSYSVTITYLRSTSNGKSLIAKGKTQGAKPYSEFFDETGVMHQDGLEKWIGGLVEGVMESSVVGL